MIFLKVILFISTSISLSSQAPNPQIKLQSKLPSNPIEDPLSWAWGQHPDGLDYKAKNSLTTKQCLANPCSLFGTPVCKTTFFHCAEYECIQRSQPCKKFCKVLGTCWCLGFQRWNIRYKSHPSCIFHSVRIFSSTLIMQMYCVNLF